MAEHYNKRTIRNFITIGVLLFVFFALLFTIGQNDAITGFVTSSIGVNEGNEEVEGSDLVPVENENNEESVVDQNNENDNIDSTNENRESQNRIDQRGGARAQSSDRASSRGPRSRAGRGAGNSGLPFFVLSGLNGSLELRRDGALLPMNRYIIGGPQQVTLEYDSEIVASFVLNVDSNLDLSSFAGYSSRISHKSVVRAINAATRDVQLYIPRENGHGRVRICEGAQNADEIGVGCSVHPHITAEYTLDIGDSRLGVSEDGLYFIVDNVSFGGGIAEYSSTSNVSDILIFNPQTSSVIHGKDDTVDISVQVLSSSSVIDIYANVTMPNGQGVLFTLVQESSTVYSGEFSSTGLNGDYQFYVVAENSEGTIRRSSDVLFHIDALEPQITLSRPFDNVGSNTDSLDFLFSVAERFSVHNCTLELNATLGGEDAVVVLNDLESLSLENIVPGTYQWRVACFDEHNNYGRSQPRKITVVKASKFRGETTDLSQINIEQIPNLVIHDPEYGKVSFTEDVNLSGGGSFDDYVTFGDNFLTIDSINMPQLNRSAELTIFNVSTQFPTILLDGQPCTDCEITTFGEDITFTVEHFSTYTVVDNAQLAVHDTTDSATKVQGDLIIFYANYSNTTDSQPIVGAGRTCNITFSDTGEHEMIYSADERVYKYNRTFGSSGVHFYNVSCIGSTTGFADINTTDYASINIGQRPVGINDISITSSERGNSSLTPVAIQAEGGNVTGVLMNASKITESWQGYFGDITATLSLSDGSNNTLYNWYGVDISGEIYATRAFDVNFPTINCSTEAEILAEEIAIGQTVNDTDSVNKTFNHTSHPAFTVGTVGIGANDCRSAFLYVNSTYQTNVFREVLLSDGASNMVYTGLLEPGRLGFDNETHNFQLIVGEDGHNGDTAVSSYYFFVELS